MNSIALPDLATASSSTTSGATTPFRRPERRLRLRRLHHPQVPAVPAPPSATRSATTATTTAGSTTTSVSSLSPARRRPEVVCDLLLLAVRPLRVRRLLLWRAHLAATSASSWPRATASPWQPESPTSRRRRRRRRPQPDSSPRHADARPPRRPRPRGRQEPDADPTTHPLAVPQAEFCPSPSLTPSATPTPD